MKCILTIDASEVTFGAILKQGTPGSDRLIAYASWILEIERKYNTIEKEILVIVWACKYIRPYLFGGPQIYSDRWPLVWIFNLKEPSSKVVRWLHKLAEYDYRLVCKKRKQNTNEDAISGVQDKMHNTESVINDHCDITQTRLKYQF